MNKEYSVVARALFWSLSLNILFAICGFAIGTYFIYKTFEAPVVSDITTTLENDSSNNNKNLIEVSNG